MKVLIEEKDLEEIERKVKNQVVKSIDFRVKEQVSLMISQLISDDIKLRKDIHKKITALKQDEINNLNAELKNAYETYINTRKRFK